MKLRVMWLLASLLTLAPSACGARRGVQRSALTRVDSSHFTLYSDLSAAEAERQTQQLEQLLAAFLEHGWDTKGDLPLHVNVVVLADRREFLALAGPEIGGYHYAPLLFEPWIVVPAHEHEQEHELQVVSHELTHYLAFQVMPHQPLWFAEGLASYFQTAEVGEHEFTLGKVPVPLLSSLMQSGPLPTAQLFDDTLDHLNPRFYATAWVLVHMLMSEHSEAFVRYQVELARGLSHAQAWQSAFPGLPERELEQQLAHYVRRGDYANFTFAYRGTPAAMRRTALRPADEDALWAVLWSSARGDRAANQKQVEQRIEAALSLAPDQPQALALRALANGGAAAGLADAERLVEQHPELWLGWLTLTQLQQQRGVIDERRPSAADRALALVPRQPFAVMLKAFELARLGDRDGALSTSKRALRFSPSNASLLWSRARLLSELGDCPPLSEVTRTIRQVRHSPLSPSQNSELAELATRCPVAASWPDRSSLDPRPSASEPQPAAP